MKLPVAGMMILLGMAGVAQAGSLPDMSSVLSPGEWAFVVEPSVQLGSMKLPEKTITHSKCVTKEDLKKTWFEQNSNKECKTISASYSGHVLSFTQKCKIEGDEVTAKGRITIDSSTAYHGAVDSTGTVNGQALKGHTTIKAHRTGACSGSKD